MKRIDGWADRLTEYIESRAQTPFEWGVHDCCSFTAGAAKAITGEDPTPADCQYSTALQAGRVVAAIGGVDKIPEACGLAPLASVRMAQRGDVVYSVDNDVESLGICCGELSFFAAEAGGVAAKKTLACVTAWRVE